MRSCGGLRLVCVMFASLAFLTIATACPDTGSRRAALPSAEVAERVRAALAQPRHLDRIVALGEALGRLDADNLPETRAVFDEHVAGLARGEVRLFVSAWSAFDVAAAHAWALSVPFEAQREEALGIVVHEWAVQDPIQARLVAEDLIIPGKKRVAAPMVRLVRGWVHRPDSGLDTFLLERPQREELVSAAVQEMYRVGGAQRVMDWLDAYIERVVEPETRRKTFRKAARTIAYRDPESASAWVVGHYAAHEYARDGPEILAESWLRRDPDEALAWLRTRAPEAARESALEGAFRAWLLRDHARARAWLAPRVDDAFLRPAIVASAKNAVRRRDPQDAVQSCGRLPPSELLQTCLHAVAAQWYSWDPVAAGEWMESSALEPALRESVRATKQKLRKRKKG